MHFTRKHFRQLSPMESVDQLQHQQNLIEAYERELEEAGEVWPMVLIYIIGVGTGVFAITILQEILTWHS